MIDSGVLRSLHFSVVSLAQAQDVATKFVTPYHYIPKEFESRLTEIGGLDPKSAGDLIRHIPSMASKPWTEYWEARGDEYHEEAHYRAACLCYLMASFPREPGHPWKLKAFEKQILSFQEWGGNDYSEHIIPTRLGKVRFYTKPPPSVVKEKAPLIVYVNGLEGAAEEIIFAVSRFGDHPVGYAFLSVPGSWDYTFFMRPDSELAMMDVLTYLEKFDWVDPTRIGMVGFSFGAYWTFIMTKLDPRIRFAVCNGIPLNHSFSMKRAYGLNPLISQALHKILRASTPLELSWKLHQLTKKANRLIEKPSGPIFAMNGTNDQIVDTRDTEILGRQPGNLLKLIPGGGHCGLFEFRHMSSLVQVWLRKQALKL